jgi:aerobic carbon-monoxide dehydrogenase small subunit
MSEHRIELSINGRRQAGTVEARTSLADYLRGDAGYTGVHVGCEHGVCGACTVMVDGRAVRSCLMLAVQADGAEVRTVEGLAAPDGSFHPVQQAMRDEHALQCGFCTPGVVMTLAALTEAEEKPSEDQLLAALSGHICRCTGYQGIRRAACRLAKEAAA